MSNFMKFSEWMKLREDCGKPHPPRGMKKIPHTEKKSSGSRMATDDLSSDYVGHVADNGDVAPYKVMKTTKSTAVAPVAK